MIGRSKRSAFILAIAVFATANIVGTAVRAADVLLNGGLELGAGPDQWTLTQVTASTAAPGDFNGNGTVDAADYVVWRKTDNGPANYTLFRTNFGVTGGGGGGQFVAASEQLDDAQEGFPESTSTGLGLLVKPFAGNVGAYQDQNKAVNLTLSQTFPQGISAATHTFHFSGDSSFQSGYSGNIDTLFADAPSGPIASPTQTKYIMEFLSATDVVLGSASVDLPRNRTDSTPRSWVNSTVTAVAPANTTKIRVSVSATNMLASCSTACSAGQDVRFDNFTLTQDASTFNKLGTRNGNLDTPGAPTNWSLVTVGNDAAAFAHDTFAIHTGQTGFWLRSFQGANGTTNAGPIDGKIVQAGAATAGTSYSFSAWAKLQAAYSGLDTGSGTQTFIKLEFLDGVDGTGNVLGTASLDLGPNGPLGSNFWPADGPDGAGQGDWRQVSVPTTVAPLGTVSFRVSAGATGMIKEPFNIPQSALFDDFSLTIPGSGLGNLLEGSMASVPEPATCWLLAVSFVGMLGFRRRSQ